jgi:hypothetical protein
VEQTSAYKSIFASFAVLGGLCANVFLFLTTHSFRAKIAKDRKARKTGWACYLADFLPTLYLCGVHESHLR